MTETPATNETQLRYIISQLFFAERWLTFVIIITVTAVSVAIAFLEEPVYRTTVTLIAADNSNSSAGLSAMIGGFGSLASLAGVNLQSDREKNEAEALLQSRQFIESFLTDNNLLPILFAHRWDAKRKVWVKTWIHPDRPTIYEAYRRFKQHVLILTEDKNTGIVSLDIDWTDPEQGAIWANELVGRINKTMRLRAIHEADAIINLLTDQLHSAPQIELQRAISGAIEFYVKRRALASVRTEYAFRVIDPAKAPDLDDYLRPKRSFYLVVGPLLGLLIAVIVIISKRHLQCMTPKR